MKQQKRLMENEKRLSDLKTAKKEPTAKLSSILLTPNPKNEVVLSDENCSTLSPTFRDEESK